MRYVTILNAYANNMGVSCIIYMFANTMAYMYRLYIRKLEFLFSD